MTADGLQLLAGRWIISQDLPQPAQRIQVEILQPGLVDQAQGFVWVSIAHQIAHVQRVGRQRLAGTLAVPRRVMTFNLAQVFEQALLHLCRNRKALDLSSLQGVGDVDGVKGNRVLALPPVGEAAVRVLQPLQPFDIPLNSRLHFRGGG